MNRFCCTFVLLSLAVFVAGCGSDEDQFGATIPPKAERDAALATATDEATSAPTVAPVVSKADKTEDAVEEKPAETVADTAPTADETTGSDSGETEQPLAAAPKEGVAKQDDKNPIDRKDAGEWVMFPKDAKEGDWEWGMNKSALRTLEESEKGKKDSRGETPAGAPAKIAKSNDSTGKTDTSEVPVAPDPAVPKSGTGLKSRPRGTIGKFQPYSAVAAEPTKDDPKEKAEGSKKLTGAAAKLKSGEGQNKDYEDKLEARLVPYLPVVNLLSRESPVALARDGRRVASLNSGRHLVVHDGESGEVIQIGVPFEEPVTAMRFIAANSIVVAATQSGKLHIRYVENAREVDELRRAYRYQRDAVRAPLQAHEGPVTWMGVTWDGQMLVTCGADGKVKFWTGIDELINSIEDLTAFSRLEPDFEIEAHKGPIVTAHITRDDTFLTTSGEDKSVRIWSLADGKEEASLTNQPQIVRALVLAPERGLMVGTTLGIDLFERALDPAVKAPAPPPLPAYEPGKPRPVRLRGHSFKGGARHESFYVPWQMMAYDKIATTMSFSPDFSKLALGSARGIVQVWSLTPFQLIASNTLHSQYVKEIVWLDETTILSTAFDRTVRRWDTTKDRVQITKRPATPQERAVSYSFKLPRTVNKSRTGVDDDDEELLQESAQGELFAPSFGEDTGDVIASHHALRSALNQSTADEARSEILKSKPPIIQLPDQLAKEVASVEEELASASTSSQKILKARIKELERQKESAAEAPRIVARIPTNLGEGRAPVVLRFNENSSQVIAFRKWDRKSEPEDQNLYVWDVLSGERLRHWHRFMPLRFPRLNFDFPIEVEDAFFLGERVIPVPIRWQFHLPTGGLNYWERPLGSIDISPNGQHLVAGVDGLSLQESPVLQLFSTATLEPLAEYRVVEGFVPVVRYMPDGDLIVASIRERNKMRLVLLDAKTLKEVDVIEEYETNKPWLSNAGTRLEKVEMGVEHIFIDPQSRVMVTHGRFKDDYVFMHRKRKDVSWEKDLEDIEYFNKSTSFFPVDFDGEPLVFGGPNSRQYAIWDGREVQVLNTKKPSPPERKVPLLKGLDRNARFRFDPLGRWCALAMADGKVYVVSLLNKNRKPKVFSAATTKLHAIEVSAEGDYLATIGLNGELMIWEMKNWADQR